MFQRIIFFNTVFLFIFVSVHAQYADELKPQVKYRSEREAALKGKELDVGSVLLEGPDLVKPYTLHTWTLVYRTGKAGIKPGGGIRFAMRHSFVWSMPQKSDPRAPGYVSVSGSTNAVDSVYLEMDKNVFGRLFNHYHPWQNIIEIIIKEPGLKCGDVIRLTLGDTSGGSPGIRVQPFDAHPFPFKTYVDPLGNNEYLPMMNNPSITITSAEPYQIVAVVPSQAVKGQLAWCLVRAEDRYGNPAVDYRGTVVFDSGTKDIVFPGKYTFTDMDSGVHRFENITFMSEGMHTIRVNDGSHQCESNPIAVKNTAPEKHIFWGDFHWQTEFSDGNGSVEQNYNFAKYIAGLDFSAVTDHAFQQTDEMWTHSKNVTNRFNQPGRFVTFCGYEWSGQREVGGDHNVYLLDDDPPIYRSRSFYNYVNFQMYHGPEPQVNHIEDLYLSLNRLLKQKNVFCVPHTAGRRATPEWHNPNVERLIEIYNHHWRSEEWVTTFLQKGYRLGIIGCSDDHTGHPGYNYMRSEGKNIGQFDFNNNKPGWALTGVYAEKFTRESIFQALYDRHCYATTGDRIILEFRADEYLMGSEIKLDKTPVFTIKAVGVSPIVSIEITKNCKVVYVINPSQREVSLQWQDPDFNPDWSCYYYVRVKQDNNEEAISSPIWIN